MNEAKIRTRHLKYFSQLAEAAESALKGPSQIEWMARLNDERDNIRAALDWADKTDVEAGLDLSSNLNIFWELFDVREGAQWLEDFVQKPESKAYPGTRANALCTLGRLSFWLQRFAEAYSVAQECLELYRASGDEVGEIDGLLLLTMAATPSQAGEFGQRALTLAQSIHDEWRTACVLFQLNWGQPDRPLYVEKALSLFQAAGDLRSMAECMAELGKLKMLNNEIESAQQTLNEATKLFQELNIKSEMGSILQYYGRITAIKGDFENAYVTLQESAAIDEKYGRRMNYLFSRSHLGYVALQRGKITEVQEIFSETARAFFNDKSEIGVVFILEGIAMLSIVIDKPDIAARLIGWADKMRERIGDRRPQLEQVDVDKIIATCLAKMGEAAFSAAYDEGQKMSLDEAVAYALGES